MPSRGHGALVEMFRHRPAPATELLADVLGVDVPAHRRVRVESGDHADLSPTEYRADAVVVLDAAGSAALPDGATGRLRPVGHRGVVCQADRARASDDLRARIAECTDLDQLDTWVRRAATALSIEDLLTDQRA